VITKDSYTHTIVFLRQEKILRDHDRECHLDDFGSGSVTLQRQFPTQANPAVAVGGDRELG
jgi:hypothetical protein